MAIIGVRYAYINGYSLGKVSSISVNMQRQQMSRLCQYMTQDIGANVSIQSNGGAVDNCFNASGTLRWCCTEISNGIKSIVCYELENVVLQKPDISCAGKQDSISFSTDTITGQSWEPNLSKVTVSSYAEALTFCQTGVEPNE